MKTSDKLNDILQQSSSCAVLMRHAERPEIPRGTLGNDLPITKKGALQSELLGRAINSSLSAIYTSPVKRCDQTAESIAEGARFSMPIEHSRLLGGPGVFVNEPDLAWKTYKKLGHDSVCENLMSGSVEMPGWHDPLKASWRMVDFILSASMQKQGAHLFITHDIILAAVVSRLIRRPVSSDQWPEFLQPGIFWCKDNELLVRYCESEKSVCPLEKV